MKKLLVLLNISFLPETTRASLGPHTTNPQVMIKAQSPTLLFYSRVIGTRVCLIFVMYITRNVTRGWSFVIAGVSNHYYPFLFSHANTKIVGWYDPRGYSNTYWIDGWLLRLWRPLPRRSYSLSHSLTHSLSYRGFLNFVEAAAVVAVVAVVSPPAASAWSRLAFKGHHK